MTAAWPQLLKDYHPDVYALRGEQDADRWENEIAMKLKRHPTNDEICDAIREGQCFNVNKLVPTPAVLCSWLSRSEHKRDEARIREEQDKSLGGYQIRLDHATPAQRWEIICEPEDPYMCQRLEDYANRLPGGSGRTDYPELRAAIRLIGREDVGDGYYKLNDGEKIKPGDEIRIGGSWVELPLRDPSGRPNRIYKNSLARRKFSNQERKQT